MSFGEPNNPYGSTPPGNPGTPGPGAPGYGYPQQPGQAPGYGIPQQGYGYPQQPGAGYGYPGQPQFGQGGMPELAHWGLRFVSRLIDSIVSAVPYIVLGVIGGALAGSGSSDGSNGKTGAGLVLVFLGVLASIGVFFWQVAKEGSTGQTIGKKAMNIRLLRESDGQTVGFGMAFVRQIAHFLDSIACYLGWLWPLWDSKKQTFADKVCSTVVVRSR